MKKLVLIISFVLLAYTVWAEETVLIATGEFPPFASEKLKTHGFVNHVIIEAFKQEEYQVKYDYFPWKRAYVQTVNGSHNATSYWYKSEKREKDCYYSDAPLYINKTSFFYVKSNPLKDWNSLESLKGLRIGATRGSTYTPEFWKAKETALIEVLISNNTLKSFQLLHLGRIDLVPTEVSAGLELIRNNFDLETQKLFEYHPKPFAQRPVFLLFPKVHKDSKKLIKVFNRGMKKVIEKGIYERLHNDLLKGKYKK